MEILNGVSPAYASFLQEQEEEEQRSGVDARPGIDSVRGDYGGRRKAPRRVYPPICAGHLNGWDGVSEFGRARCSTTTIAVVVAAAAVRAVSAFSIGPFGLYGPAPPRPARRIRSPMRSSRRMIMITTTRDSHHPKNGQIQRIPALFMLEVALL